MKYQHSNFLNFPLQAAIESHQKSALPLFQFICLYNTLNEIPISKYVQVQTEINGSKFDSLTNEVSKLECTVENQRFGLSNVSKDESKLCFYTEFTSFTALMACYNF